MKKENSCFNRESITRGLAEVERHFPVETFVSHGLHIWPLLRIWFCFSKAEQYGRHYSPPPRPPSLAGRVKTAACTLASAVAEEAKQRLGGTARPWETPADVIFVGPSNRALPLGPIAYNTVAEPLAERLHEKGLKVALWETGRPVPRRIHRVCPISEFLRAGWWKQKLLGKVPRPEPRAEWFDDLAKWGEEFLGRPVHWTELESFFANSSIHTRILEEWLRCCGARHVVLDCWYDLVPMTAAAAARGVGIPSLDIQHGLQGSGHYAYSGWLKSPPAGYEMLPRQFWTWGTDDRENLLRNTPALFSPESVWAGGNLWLHKWIQGDNPDMRNCIKEIREITRGFSRSILVTLQKTIRYDDGPLMDVIRSSPSDFLWLIRPHRHSDIPLDEIERDFRATGHPGIRIHEAQSFPLYALFHAVSAHVTWFSTCALEALPFGVPSILLHSTAHDSFARFLDAKVMIQARTKGEFIRALGDALSINPKACVEASTGVFSDAGGADQAISQIFISRR